jgi:hypothetical protein
MKELHVVSGAQEATGGDGEDSRNCHNGAQREQHEEAVPHVCGVGVRNSGWCRRKDGARTLQEEKTLRDG